LHHPLGVTPHRRDDVRRASEHGLNELALQRRRLAPPLAKCVLAAALGWLYLT
jgi:hypothetical protein